MFALFSVLKIKVVLLCEARACPIKSDRRPPHPQGEEAHPTASGGRAPRCLILLFVLVFFGLQVKHIGISAILFHQFTVSTTFDYTSVFHNKNSVCHHSS